VGSPQDIFDALEARAEIVTDQSYSLFVTGPTAPTSDEGPWFKNGNTLWVWDVGTGAYVPIMLDSKSLRYLVTQTLPADNTDYDVIFLLDPGSSPAGAPIGVMLWYNGAWVDLNSSTGYVTVGSMNAAIAAAIAAATVSLPTGAMMLWGLSAPPAGYILANGGTQLISAYPTLAAVYGTLFGGDGMTTFGIPDLRGRAPVGVGTGDAADATTWTLAQKKGTETHALSVSELPATPPNLTLYKITADGNVSDPSGFIAGLSGTQPTTVNANTYGSGNAHNTLQPSLAVNFIIKT
jgi:microcystin-dependent protein